MKETMTILHFEDFQPGWNGTFGPLSVTKEDIIDFASEYDPQPFHLNEEAAKTTFPGRLIASGWHSCALLSRLVVDNILNKSVALGSPGIDEVKWLRPVLPGDRLRAHAFVTEAKISKSRPDTGLVRFQFELLNQSEKPTLTQTCWIIFRRRHPGAIEADSATSRTTRAQRAQNTVLVPSAIPFGETIPFFGDLKPGMLADLGGHPFIENEIVRFASAYDPQYFHLDPEAAKRSLFGGLCASGWNTCANWMRLFARHRQHLADMMEAQNKPVPQLGSSPGFSNLKWLKPVFAGDIIRYRSILVEKRPSVSRPNWGLVFHHNTGMNQHAEKVFEFDSVVFWQKQEGRT